jgi:two-component system, sensor histidine kinase
MIHRLAAKLSLDINDANLVVRRAQIRARLDQYVLMAAIQMLLAIIMVWLMWGHVTHFNLLCWVVLLLASKSLELGVWWRYRQYATTVHECQQWRNRFLIFTALTASIMGSAGVVMFVPNDIAYQALLICIMLGLSAGAVTINPVYPAVMYLYTLLIILPIGFTTLLVNDQIHSLLAMMLLLYLLFILHTGQGLAKTFAVSLQRREENVELVLQLLAEKKTANAAHQLAEESNRSKSKFLAAASHDLRQPMHALSLFVEALKPHVASDAGTQIVTKVEHTVEVLGEMLDALLDVSRLDAGGVTAHYQQFSAQNLFRQMQTEFADSAHEQGLQLRIEPCEVSIYSDPMLLERIVRNLLVNALRYTQHGEISLRGHIVGQHLKIEVSDTGIGIAAHHLPQIFDEYFQVGNAQRDRSQGLGLGLAIVQRLAQLLACPVQVESKLGRGSRFILQVPLHAD